MALLGDQKKIDANKDGKITAKDFKMLRKQRKRGGLLDDDMNRLALAEGNKDDGNLRAMLMQQKAMQMMRKSPLDDVAYDQMIMDMEENPKISGFRKAQSNFDMFIQDQESKDMFLNLLKNRDEILEREQKAEGGDVDSQMAMLMEPQQEQAMVPDEDMEEDYLDFILDEALTEEEEEMLQSRLEQDEQLALLFDKVIDVAQEFAGAGLVEGPGNGVSDSIPARLSDGEFVFTAKAVEEIGADELMRMMKDAEAKADERQGFVYGGEVLEEGETFMVEPTEPEPVKQEIRVQRETVGPQATEQEEEELVEEIRTRKMMTGKASPVS
jgi:hypothetical protein